MPGHFQEFLDQIVANWRPEESDRFLGALENAFHFAASARDCDRAGQSSEQAWYNEEAGLALAEALLILRRYVPGTDAQERIRRLLYLATGIGLSVTLLGEIWEPIVEEWREPVAHLSGRSPLSLRLEAVVRARARVNFSPHDTQPMPR